VLGIPDDEAGEVPNAFRVPATTEIDAAAVVAFVADQIARYNRIREIGLIDAIPRSSSGKILRRLMRDLHPTDLNRPRRHRGGSSHCRRRRRARCGDRQARLD
jgi:acyl-coenzyme A synthetase/AMP-(fatty) acid ligase